MNLFQHWLNMGGYSCYVWPAYGFAVGVLGINLLSIKRQQKRTHKLLQEWFKR